MSWSRMFLILWRLQLRRWLNRLESWQRRGCRIGFGCLLLGLTLIGLHLVMAGSLDRLLNPDDMRDVLKRASGQSRDLLRFTRYEDVPDQSARLMLMFLQGTWLSALFLKWGHWQSLDRDAEWEWFAERPWPSLTLFVQRCLLESLWPQVFSLLIGSFLVLLGLRRGLSPVWAFGLSMGLVLILQALLAAPRLTVDLWLRQRWPSARVRTWRGISGILGAGLLVLSMQALSMDQFWAARVVINYGEFLDFTPAGFALSTLILHEQDSRLRYAWLLLTLVLLMHAVCYTIAARILLKPWRGFQGWSLPSAYQQKSRSGLMLILWQKLHPLTRRDLILLARDRHFLLQMLVAPIIVAIIPQGLPLHDPAWVFLMAFGSGLFFLWSAVLHILPMEGRSLWMLFTWPQSLAQFLWRRLRVLLALAGCFAVLVLTLGWFRSDWDAGLGDLWRLAYLAMGLVGFGLWLTALAVLTFEPEAEYGGERPRLLLHYGMLIPGALYGWLFLRPEGYASLVSLMILAVIAGFFWWRMMRMLPLLLDRPLSPKKNLARMSFRLYLFKFMTR